jgi:hypothetical protein
MHCLKIEDFSSQFSAEACSGDGLRASSIFGHCFILPILAVLRWPWMLCILSRKTGLLQNHVLQNHVLQNND